jgi:hypothetical protein
MIIIVYLIYFSCSGFVVNDIRYIHILWHVLCEGTFVVSGFVFVL